MTEETVRLLQELKKVLEKLGGGVEVTPMYPNGDTAIILKNFSIEKFAKI